MYPLAHQLLRIIALAAATAPLALAGTIPLKTGLVIVSASRFDYGDFEALTAISSADAKQVTLSVEAVRQNAEEEQSEDPSPFKSWEKAHFERVIQREDLTSSTRMNQVFIAGDPDAFPGSTTDIASARVLSNLRSVGETPFILGTVTGSAPSFGSMLGSGRRFFRGKLQRVEVGNVQVLLNGEPTPITAIHARGPLSLGEETIDFDVWIADDPDNALVLKVGEDQYQVIRIDYPVDGSDALGPGVGVRGAGALDEALTGGDCEAELHGIYFDSGKADILAPSRPTLEALAEVLNTHDEWSVSIAGHTDSVGDDAYNLDLSRRRAGAVAAALSNTFGIDAGRLRTDGHGEAEPIGDNGTLEGRARNRRVEISRECSEKSPL